MSAENVELIQRAHELVASEGYEAILELIAPEFEFTTPASMAAEPDTYRGPEGIRRWYESFYEAMDEVRFEPERFVAVGDWVVVPAKLITRGRESGLEIEQRVVLAWAVRGGKAVRLLPFADEEQAMRAVAEESAQG